MSTLLYLFLIVLLSASAAGILLVIMVKKYYWGPTGVPPKQRYKQTRAESGQTTPLQSDKKKEK